VRGVKGVKREGKDSSRSRFPPKGETEQYRAAEQIFERLRR
jgi:hypothetical protein